jgi:hypothetical protein
MCVLRYWIFYLYIIGIMEGIKQMQIIKFVYHTICKRDHMLCEVDWERLCTISQHSKKQFHNFLKIYEPPPNSRHLKGSKLKTYNSGVTCESHSYSAVCFLCINLYTFLYVRENTAVIVQTILGIMVKI